MRLLGNWIKTTIESPGLPVGPTETPPRKRTEDLPPMTETGEAIRPPRRR